MTFQFNGRQYDKDGLPIEETPPSTAKPQVDPSLLYQPQQQTPGFTVPTPQPAPFAQPLAQQPGYGVAPSAPVGYQQKSWVAATLLAFFLGSFGVHNFYLGYSSRAKIQLFLGVGGLLLTPIFIGIIPVTIVAIWAFIEFLMILLSVGDFAHDAQGLPLQK